MTTRAMFAAGRTAPHRRRAAHRARTNRATLIALTLFLAVLIAEAEFLALNGPTVADLGALAAVALTAPSRALPARVRAADIASAPGARPARHFAATLAQPPGRYDAFYETRKPFWRE